MAEEIGIVMSLYDKVSPTLKSIGNSTKAFDKNLQELEQSCKAYEKSQEGLNKDISTLKTKLAECNDKVKASTKAWRDNKNELTHGAMKQAIAEQEEFKAKLKDTEAALNSQRKSVIKLAEETRRAENAGGGTTGLNAADSLLGSLKNAGLFKLAGDALAQAAGAGLESALGQPTATAVSGILSGIASGASMGMMTGTPHGVVIGAAIGAGAGVLNAVTTVGKAEDDAFKSYVQENTEAQLSRQSSDVQSGSAIAAQRQKDLISFSTLFKDRGTAGTYLGELVDMANTTPFLYDDLTAMSKTLATYGYGAQDILPVLSTIGDAGAALGMSTGDMGMVATALGRMKSSNKTTLEYLNILNDRGVGAVGMLADAYGVDQGTMYDMISKGKVAGRDAVNIILEALTDSFSGSMAEQSKTFSGLSSTLQGMEQEMQNAYGEGYNEERGEGIQQQIDWFSGASGKAQEEANKAIGAWQASLENAKERYIREAVDDAMRTDEYQTAKAAGAAAEMGRIIMEAKVKGQGEYNANEGKDEALAQELALADGIRKDSQSNRAYWDAGYVKGQAYSKGRLAGMLEEMDLSGMDEEAAASMRTYMGIYAPDAVPMDQMMGFGSSHAYGLDRVPYDGYPALLHEGERVLTAREARRADRGGGAPAVQVTVTGNSFYGSDSAMEERVARRIAREVRRAVLLAAP